MYAIFVRTGSWLFSFRLENAQQDFAQAKLNIRNGEFIDYRQLGMPVKLTVEQVKAFKITDKMRKNEASLSLFFMFMCIIMYVYACVSKKEGGREKYRFCNYKVCKNLC